MEEHNNYKNLKNIYDEWDDEKLIRAMTIHKDDYTDEALDVMNEIIETRDIDKNLICQIKAEKEEENIEHDFDYFIFKTPNSWSYYQIFSIIIFSPIVIWGVVNSPYDKIMFVLLKLILIGGVYLYIKIILSWFSASYKVIIDDEFIKGYNLFGKERKIKINDIKRLNKVSGFHRMRICDRNEKFIEIVGDIDYYGFLMDCILGKIKNLKHIDIDYKTLERLRGYTKIWKYTRRSPFSTKYPDGYLSWLEPIVNEQRIDMINKGILKENVFYGEKERP